MKNGTIILAIETSCDDTGIAIIKASSKGPIFNVLSNIVSSQIKIHKKYGGVYPMMAKREHQKNLIPVLTTALKNARMLKISNFQFSISNKIPNSNFQTLKKILIREELLYKKLTAFLRKYQNPDIDAIAVTTGPGLEPCLWVGVNFAKALAYYWDIPIVPVNHIEAHLLVNFLNYKLKTLPRSEPKVLLRGINYKLFPAVCLVVSGGHTQLILMKNFDDYKILGETRDDAAGECFDKTARILGLGYPGGPAIAAQAAKSTDVRHPQTCGCRTSVRLPRPMINTKDYDFSFSGLKTAVLYNFKNQPEKTRKSKKYVAEICTETQQAIIDVLLKKTIKATKDFKAKTIILGGGVAANEELRNQMQKKIKKELLNLNFLIPPPEYCTDNGVMTAITAYFHRKETKNWQKIKAEANLRIEE